MAKAVARRAVLDGKGSAMPMATSMPVSPEAIDALLEIWPVFEAFQTQYVAQGLMLDAEKNASAPSPTGPSAGATATARPAGPCPDCPARLNRPQTLEGWQVWDLAQRLGGQLRVIPGASSAGTWAPPSPGRGAGHRLP
jgi:hypothetical protein